MPSESNSSSARSQCATLRANRSNFHPKTQANAGCRASPQGCPYMPRLTDSVSLRCSAWKTNGHRVPAHAPCFGHSRRPETPMAAIERTASPRFTPALTASELQTLYAPTDEARAFVAAQTRGPAQALTRLVLLKCPQHLGSLPVLADVPAPLRTYLWPPL